MLSDIGAAEGAVPEQEAELLERVFQFRDRRVNEIMVPRTEVVWLEAGTTINDFYALYAQHPHSRFPVFSESIDHVSGVVGIKDVLRAVSRDEVEDSSPIESCLRPALFMPETKRIGSLFWEMQPAGAHPPGGGAERLRFRRRRARLPCGPPRPQPAPGGHRDARAQDRARPGS